MNPEQRQISNLKFKASMLRRSDFGTYDNLPLIAGSFPFSIIPSPAQQP